MNILETYHGVLAFGIAVTPIAVVLLVVFRDRLSRIEGSFLLVLWGLFIVVAEHVGFGFAGFGGSGLDTHSGFHFQMLAAYGLAAFALAGAIIAPSIRRGEKTGWYGLLLLFVIGISAEVATAAITTPHGVPPRWWSLGLALWSYPLAWATALILSFRPILRSATHR